MTRELKYKKVLSENSSFQLIRTNPKLTGNIKLTVNENDEIWLNSIPANLELAKDDFSRFPVDTSHSLASNIFRFFKNGETPNEIIFQLSEKVDSTKTSKDFKDQFDFSNYFSGIKYLPSKKYDERLAYFAPLYLKDEIPNYFIIFKIKDPLNKPIYELRSDYESGIKTKGDYLIDFFKKATIVKTFDLRQDTKIGKLLRDYRFNQNFPTSPLTVNFREDQYTTWNGILVNSGIFGSRGELLSSLYQSSTPLKFFEENITKGFERNGVIFPNIINLEFIFNDEESNLYEFDRYIGFYVNSIDVASLQIDLERAYNERTSWENLPTLKRRFYDYEEVSITQENSSGVILPYKNLDINLIEFTDIFKTKDSLYFNYLTDRDDNFYLTSLSEAGSTDPNSTGPYTINYSVSGTLSLSWDGDKVTVIYPNHSLKTDDLVRVSSQSVGYSGDYFITVTSDSIFTYIPNVSPTDPSTSGTVSFEIGKGKIKLSNTKIDLGKFFGPSNEIFLQDKGNASSSPGFSSIAIKIKDTLNHLDQIKLYHPNGTRIDALGKYDIFTGVENYQLTSSPGSYYSYNDFDGVAGGDVFYFNCKGLVNEIAAAISGVINSTRNRTFTAYSLNDYVFIKCNVPGDYDIIHKIEFISPSLDYSRVTIGDLENTLLQSTQINFSGGSKQVGNRLVLSYSHFEKIKNNLSDLLIRTEEGWSGISKISRYFDSITEFATTSVSKIENAISEYNEKMVITLQLNQKPSIRYSDFLIRKKHSVAFGLISFFPIKDLDFDFLTSTYLNFPKIDLYENYYIPVETSLLMTGISYKVVGGTILVESVEYSDGDYFTVTQDNQSYSAVLGDPIVTYLADTTASSYALTYGISDENNELKDFQGFSILKDPSKIGPIQNSEVFSLRDKFINGLTSTEYDFYKENIATDFALRSKIIPYINKWSIKGGKDSRDNPYRLNTEIVFGRNNFSPDHTDRSQNPDTFTHEWFYIESNFNYVNSLNTVKENYYYFESPLDETKLLDDPDYFINYFTYTPSFSDSGSQVEVGPTQFRYSKIYKNAAGQYETFFKGFKIAFKDVVNTSIIGSDNKPIPNNQSNRFDGYNFSCLLKPIKEDFFDLSKPPIKYEIIEHKDFKFILVLIKIYIGSEDNIHPYWKENNTLTTREAITNDLVSLTDFYFADSSYSTEFGTQLPYETIFGEYRIKFNQDNVSNLNYNLIYSLKNKKFNIKLDNFSNVKLSKKINLAQPILSNTLEELINPLIQNYPSIFSNEILRPLPNKFISAKNIQLDSTYIIDSFVGLTPQNINPISTVGSSTIQYSGTIKLASIISTYPYTSLFSSLPLNSGYRSIIENNFQFFVIGGGEKYFERLFENISFARFKQYVNSYDSFIEYYSYSTVNGSSVLSQDAKFYLDILDQSEIFKINQVIPVTDEDRPSQFSLIENLSYKYEVGNLSVPLQLNRYSGEYEPILTDLLYCNSSFNFIKNKIENITLANIKFNTEIENLMTISNFGHIKISDTKILSLESDDQYLPIYPAIGEIAIGFSNYFLFNSNWDWGFHYKWSDKLTNYPVSGTLRVEEDESYTAKILSVPSNIELNSFNILILPETSSLSSVNIDEIEIVSKEQNDRIEGYINLNNVLTRYFIEDGIESKFNEFLSTSNDYIGSFSSIQEYVKAYIKENILELYDIEEVEFYKKVNATLTSTTSASNVNLITFEFLSDQDRFKLGYSRIKTVEINKLDKLILKFSIKKDINSGFSVSPKLKIKFI